MKEHLLNSQTWLRGFFMLLFLIISVVLRMMIGLIIIFQFGSLLLTGQLNPRLLTFSDSLCNYTYDVMSYLTFNSEEKPFPFAPWPQINDAD